MRRTLLFLRCTKVTSFFFKEYVKSLIISVSRELILKLVERDCIVPTRFFFRIVQCHSVGGELYYHICCIIVSSNCLSMIYLWRYSLRFEKQSLSAGKPAIWYYRKNVQAYMVHSWGGRGGGERIIFDHEKWNVNGVRSRIARFLRVFCTFLHASEPEWSGDEEGGYEGIRDSKVEVEEERGGELFHKLDRAQIAVICRHKLHDRIIVLCAEYEKRSRARRNRRESPPENSAIPDASGPSKFVALTELQRINKHGFRYVSKFLSNSRLCDHSHLCRCKTINSNRYLFKRTRLIALSAIISLFCACS